MSKDDTSQPIASLSSVKSSNSVKNSTDASKTKSDICEHFNCESVQTGFFSKNEAIALCILIVSILIGSFWLFVVFEIDSPNGIGGGKFLVIFPVFMLGIIYKIKKSIKKSVITCKDCGKYLS